MTPTVSTEKSYSLAKERYAEWGVDAEAALKRLEGIAISIQCWQGDDVGGFESAGGLSGGGIMATGNYPGRARTPDELRADAAKAFSLIPGKHRFSLHAIYLEHGGKPVERNEVAPAHFQRLDGLGGRVGHRLGLQFDVLLAPEGGRRLHAWPIATRASAASGSSTASPAARSARPWAAARATPCIHNVWIPDGMKDVTIDRKGPREILKKSLDEMFAPPIDPALCRDAVEAKLFGIGSETYVVGSHEFYLGYAVANQKLLTLDAGHFHPTETIADKISAVLLYLDEILLHVSRGVRWDSDHVVILTDDLRAIAEEIVRGDFLDRVHVGLDFFDASINRVAAWVIGTRAMLKALLLALLEPTARLRELEVRGDFTSRLALVEELQDASLRRRVGLLLPEARDAGGHGVDGGSEAIRKGRAPKAIARQT